MLILLKNHKDILLYTGPALSGFAKFWTLPTMPGWQRHTASKISEAVSADNEAGPGRKNSRAKVCEGTQR
jgi:hypothetical protein